MRSRFYALLIRASEVTGGIAAAVRHHQSFYALLIRASEVTDERGIEFMHETTVFLCPTDPG